MESVVYCLNTRFQRSNGAKLVARFPARFYRSFTVRTNKKTSKNAGFTEKPYQYSFQQYFVRLLKVL